MMCKRVNFQKKIRFDVKNRAVPGCAFLFEQLMQDLPSPRGKPPAPPVRRSSDLTGGLGDPEPEVSGGQEVQESQAVTSSSEASVASSYLTRTCSLPRHKRIGQCKNDNIRYLNTVLSFAGLG